MNVSAIKTALAPYGLKLRGITTLNDNEKIEYDFHGYATIALVGNIGSSYWTHFSASDEFSDEAPDPLDRWSRRVAGEVASELNARATFPFQGPPYLPFLQWAKRAENLHQSPLGLMMHPKFGLWHSYRFALLLEDVIESEKPLQASPCESCVNPPCLTSCPVNAFSAKGYDVNRCAQYLHNTPSAGCFQHGCMARYECPVARDYRYQDAQSQFHLQAFITARPILARN